ncbi:enoyl-CoA hydratase/isomerase family protein, partial [Mycobacterium celatum]
MSFAEIEVTVDGARAAITLNRPDKLNPLSTTTLTELVEAARELDTRSGVKVAVISGRGRAFSAGADLASFAAQAGPP